MRGGLKLSELSNTGIGQSDVVSSLSGWAIISGVPIRSTESNKSLSGTIQMGTWWRESRI
ncbi:uncharacterized protein BKA55DRAFT_553802 [Fusarium redolens]|uniref:Uncharacterized protein n=1 Tax=Fusarium redolens TaxID=48865 RepID=A0A9P9KQZ9_FUSRE|nr:uncharacterized protein BKA55DRAFT_553802 [Fusarium redolens]KAH7266941.1 hypothetical protein BKA55DRAFT_553802 [Fusarium redolens]